MRILNLIVFLGFALFTFQSYALIEGEDVVGSDVDAIITRCETQSNDELKLSCYQQQLSFLNTEGRVQSDEGFSSQHGTFEVDKKCHRDFCEGEDVFYNPDSSTSKAQILKIDELNRFTLKVLKDDGSVAEIINDKKFDELIKASGCHYGICVGDRVYQSRPGLEDSMGVVRLEVVIVGISSVGTFTVDYIGREFDGRYGSKWDLDDFALFDGCIAHTCVGQTYTIPKRDNATVRVIAIRYDGKLIIEYITGEHADGKHYGKWSPNSLVPIE